VHQRALFSSSYWPSTLERKMVSDTGDSAEGRDSIDCRWMNSPDATSNEVLVLPSLGTMGEDENHPPGKKRDEVVDSSLLRVWVAEGSSRLVGESSVFAYSSTDGRCNKGSFVCRLSVDSS